MTHAKYEDDELVIVDLVHDPVVARANSPLPRATYKPGRGWWSGLNGEELKGCLDTAPDMGVELAELAGG